MYSKKPARRAKIVWYGAVLTCVAGYVDAAGFLALGGIYVANMSGNTIAVAIHLSSRDWRTAWAHACPLLAFVPGLIAGDAIVEAARQSKLRSRLAPAALLEFVALAAFMGVAHAIRPSQTVVEYRGAPYAVLVGLLAFSMGAQNGALRRVGALQDVHTYVTGTLLAAANGLTQFFIWLAKRLYRSGRWRSPGRSRFPAVARYALHHRSLRSAALAATLWMAYISGAMIGALALFRFGVQVFLAPAAILLGIAITDIIQPLRSEADKAVPD